ncbi:MAG: TonB-dependent receptor [Gammaproteobacteria bacterium]|nr:TonB-dependent receptor [Gammaproteobacteria bacterium]
MALAVGAALVGGAFVTGPQQARAQGGALEEIVVTSRYREENMQQTPLAVSAFTAETLEVRGITEIENLGDLVPNAFIRPSGTTPFVGIRGKINGDVFANFEPTTALYIDGTYWGRQVGMNFDLYDIDRVEVLRGPQGTLFGKNALAGAIRIVTARPQGDDTGYAELTYGDYNQVELRGMFDVALSENWYMRVTGVSKKQDGYIDRLDWACQMKLEGTPELAGYGDGIGGATQVGVSPFGTPIYEPVYVEPGSEADMAFAFPERQQTQKDEIGHPDGCSFGTFRGTDSQGGRVQLRWAGSDTVDVVMSADVTEEDSDAFGALMYQGPSSLSALDQWWIRGEVLPRYGLTPETFTGGTADPRDGAFWRDPRSYQVFETLDDPMNDQDFDKGAQVRNWGVSLNVEADLTDLMSLTYIGSYRELGSDFSGRSGTTQGDSTPFDYIHNYDTFDHTQLQHEVRLDGTSFGKLDWTVGAFYFDSKDQNHVNVEIEPLTFLGIFPTKIHRDRFINTNRSVFAHTVFHATDDLAVTGGLRWTDEERIYQINQLGILVLNDPLETAATRTDWKLGLDYNLTDERMVYASMATGFRSEGFQPRPWTPSQVLPFDQEEVLSYELGYKGDFLDNRLRMNIAAFYEEYDPRVISVGATQCNLFDAEDPGPPFFDADLVQTPGGDLVCPPGTPMAGQPGFNFSPYVSAPGIVQGIEIELTANPTDNLTLSYTLGHNQFETDETDPDSPAYRHPDALLQPETNMSAGIQYDFVLGNGGILSPRLDAAYQGQNTTGDPTIAPTSENIIPSYTLYNARLTYLSPAETWRASLAVRNLTDEFYWYAFASPTGGGFSVPGSPGAPRMWSLSVRREF